MNTYLEIISHTPIPTMEQTESFIHLVARDHSWYKHLEREIPTEFIFFLDPNARRPFKLDENGNVVFQLLSDEQLSELSSCYGTWRYYNKNHTQKVITDNDGYYRDLNPFIGLSIIGQTGEIMELPQETINFGKIGLTAYLHWSFGDYEPTRRFHQIVLSDLTEHLMSLRQYYNGLPPKSIN